MTSQRKILHAWCMYDWANSGFPTTVMAAVLPIFFRQVGTISIAAEHRGLATALWGYTNAAAMLLLAVISLLLGPVADRIPKKKQYLGYFLALGAAATLLLGFTGPGMWICIALLYVLGSTGFSGSEIFYDSLLPHIVEKGRLNYVSTRGYATGYLGGGILLLINIVMIALIPQQTIGASNASVPLLAMRLSFISVAAWWLLFAVPLFKHVPEPVVPVKELPRQSIISISVSRLKRTAREIRHYKNIIRFLIAFWIYNDGIGTVIKMATAFGNEIGIGTLDLIGALLATQAVGVPSTLLFGKIADRIGTKRSILITLAVYTGICTSAFFMRSALHFWILAVTVGLVQGGSQALSRAMFGSIIPRDKSSEFFTFYHISGKFAGIAGPFIFGVLSQITGSGRAGILSLVLFFVLGACILIRVKEPGTS